MEAASPKQQLGSPEVLAWIGSRVCETPELSRYALAREVCERLEWRNEAGVLKEMACRKHLLRLERRGEIVLPAARRARPQRRHDRAVTVPEPEFSGTLAGLGEIELAAVSAGTVASRHWNAMMETHHPQGSGPLCGAQLRYLIVSQRLGVVGGLAVSAPAWRLGARDDWLGWSDAERAIHLSGIVCNSRFLILPSIRVKHLGSHALGLLTRRIAADWPQRYGIRPWLMESCVELSRPGTVYRAANWIEVGLTKGRGRQDRGHKRDLPLKRVFVYPLCRAMLKRLCGQRPMPEPGWVQREFAGARLGDRRLQQRLLGLASAFFSKPAAGILQACGSWAATKAAYRFFQHKRTTMKALLEPHRQATIERIAREPVVLVVQDTSSLNYTTLRDMTGIGPIGSTADGPQGLMLHNTLAFRPDGLPLGILDVHCWPRDKDKFGIKHERQARPIEDKESYKWLRPLAGTGEIVRACPDTCVVTVTDAEGDIHEFFDEARKQDCRFLVRACENRRVQGSTDLLWAHVQSMPQAAEIELQVPRHAKQPARTARMSLRFGEITLASPTKKPHLPPIRLWAVSSQEVDAPDNIEPLEWLLLTDLPTPGLDDALERLQWYSRRWGIEVFHRILKSGCQIEERQLGTAKSLQACLAIDMVVAWRIHHLTWLGRATPELPCTVAFDDDQWKAIVVFNTRKTPPEQPPSLAQMILLVAKLGGFLARKGDGKPGTENMWRGLQRMDDITATFQSILAAYRPQPP